MTAPSALATTFGQLLSDIRSEADLLNSQVVTDAELRVFAARSYCELVDLIHEAYDDDFLVADPYTLTTNGTDETFSLPGDFGKLLGVDIKVGQYWINVKRFQFGDRNRYASVLTPAWGFFLTNLRYRLIGTKIWIKPVPPAGVVFRLWYAPAVTAITSDSTSLPDFQGWLEYVVIDAAIKCKRKQEMDTGELQLAKDRLEARIRRAGKNRDVGSPPKVTDVMSGPFGDYSGGPGFFGNGW